MYFPGKKTIDVFNDLIKRNLPSNLEDFTYVEPFGGTFGIGNIIKSQVKETIYNDILIYPWVNEIVKADVIHHLDFFEIIKKYDSPQTLFYIDPPYYKKEFVYGIEHSPEFHSILFDVLSTIKGKFLLSYEDDRTIVKLYRGFKIDYYDGERSLYKKEILISNV